MALLRVGAEDAGNVRIAVDGVVHQFADHLLEVDDATAESIRRQSKTLFPHLGIVVVKAGSVATEEPPAPASPESLPLADDLPPAPAPAGQDKSLDRMNLAELRDAAAARDIGTDGLTKAEIRKLIEA